MFNMASGFMHELKSGQWRPACLAVAILMLVVTACEFRIVRIEVEPTAPARPTPTIRSGGATPSATGTRQSHSWTVIGRTLQVHATPSLTLLPDGLVLIDGQEPFAEIYDPENRSIEFSAPSRCSRHASRATPLRDGTVLFTGTSREPGCAEVFDPVTRTFSRVGDLDIQRTGHASTLLADGRVLISGGQSFGGQLNEIDGITVASAEIYDPVTRTFSPTGSMNLRRENHAAFLLPSGLVVIAGGQQVDLQEGGGGATTCHSSVEIFDPVPGTFELVFERISAGCDPEATPLMDGRFLVTSGDTADTFDPATMEFSPAGKMATDHGRHTTALLPSGEVLVIGGWEGRGVDRFIPSGRVEVFDPETMTFSLGPPLNIGRWSLASAVTADGLVLVVGGNGDSSSTPIFSDDFGVDSIELLAPAGP